MDKFEICSLFIMIVEVNYMYIQVHMDKLVCTCQIKIFSMTNKNDWHISN